MRMDLSERIMIPERIRIPVLGGIWYRFLTKQKRKAVFNQDVSKLELNHEPRPFKIICTLTSFPGRIESVQYTIKTLFNQTMKPDRIILWLAAEEFQGVELPDCIKKLQTQGLEVRFCKNMFGHKRYYKLIEEQKDDELIVMFDDDILFPRCLIERLYTVWEKNPNCIVCDRGQLLTFNNGELVNPGYWSTNSDVGLHQGSYCILASPGGGCLLPPKALYKDANNCDLIQKYALKTGDIWLMFMACENDTKIMRTYKYHRIFILSEDEQKVQLGREAIYQGRYVKTFNELKDAYPHAYQNMMMELKYEK